MGRFVKFISDDNCIAGNLIFFFFGFLMSSLVITFQMMMENFISSVMLPIRVKFVEQVHLFSFELLLQWKSCLLWKMKEILTCWW